MIYVIIICEYYYMFSADSYCLVLGFCECLRKSQSHTQSQTHTQEDMQGSNYERPKGEEQANGTPLRKYLPRCNRGKRTFFLNDRYVYDFNIFKWVVVLNLLLNYVQTHPSTI